MESVNVCKFCNMEDGQCGCIGFVLMPRQLTDEMGELLAEKARVCGGGAFEIWEALLGIRPTEADHMKTIQADEIHQIAFEEGQPAENGDGYLFTTEEFDLFVERLLSANEAATHDQ